MYYGFEAQAQDAGDASGTVTLWQNLYTDISTSTNGSPRYLDFTCDLRGVSVQRDPATGLPVIPAEPVPAGLAAALHAPFMELTHEVEWKVVGADVDWTTQPGWSVGVQNAGNDQISGGGARCSRRSPANSGSRRRRATNRACRAA